MVQEVCFKGTIDWKNRKAHIVNAKGVIYGYVEFKEDEVIIHIHRKAGVIHPNKGK